MKQENEKESAKVSFKDAKTFIEWLRKKENNKSIDLPTLKQLQTSKKANIYFAGKEWTKEGWIYDPIKDEVNKNPSLGATASFRIVSSKSD